MTSRGASCAHRTNVARLWTVGPLVAIGASVLAVALLSVGPTGAAPRTAAVDAQQIYLRDCAVCHGADARGTSTGPTLQGVGAAAVDYQVSTGRMPLDTADAIPTRRTPKYDAATIDALVQYVATVAPGGPAVPTIDVAAADVAAGGAIYRAQCAACHQWAGEGGALQGGNAPSVLPATPTQIAEAVRTGPATMPVFGDQAISDQQLTDLVGYVRSLEHPVDAGGSPLWHLGPLPEGAVALLALAALVVVLRLIGTRTVKRADRIGAFAFFLATLGAVGFLVSFWSGGEHTQLQGLSLAVAFLGIGLGLIVWASVVAPADEQVQERTSLRASAEETAALDDELARGEEAIGRRVWLRRGAIAAGGTLGIALVSPLRSLGPRPGYSLTRTAWRGGARVVNESGDVVRAADVPDDGLLTVFPEGAVGAADAQAVLVRVDAALLRLPHGRDGWAPGGLLAYSKVCSHAGCPVGLYEADRHELLCPCHQSSFDVLRGALPVSGPAAWSLPQLALVVDADGALRSAGDFSSPVGPGWWQA